MVCFKPVSGKSVTTSAKKIRLYGCKLVAETTCTTKSVLPVSSTSGTTSDKYIIVLYILRWQCPFVLLTGKTELVA